MAFENTTIFLAPVWFDDYERFTKALQKDSRFAKRDCQNNHLLMPYCNRLVANQALFSEYDLKAEHIPMLYMYEECYQNSGKAILSLVRVCCFATGCGFVELHVTYDGLSVDEITNFAFYFRKADRKRVRGEATPTMYETLCALLPSMPQLQLFFSETECRRECRVFHQLLVEDDTAVDIPKALACLCRGYGADFRLPQDDTEDHVLYEPYPYDHWAGSKVGLVNVSCESDSRSGNYFLQHYKQDQLMNDYRFMYLMLLNQRFSAMRYLELLADIEHLTAREAERLDMRISKLQTVYAFTDVSEDRMIQTLYAQLRQMWNIDRLLDEIRNNEEQVVFQRGAQAAKTEKLTATLLLGLSFLSLFSTLVDAAGFFERFSTIRPFATGLSVGCTLTIFVVMIVWWTVNRRR